MFKKLIYGNDYLQLFFLDKTLSLFKMSDFFSNEVFYGKEYLHNFELTVQDLESDGFITVSQYGVSITLKGKRMIKKGGYRRKAFIKRLTFFTVIIGTIGAIASVIGLAV